MKLLHCFCPLHTRGTIAHREWEERIKNYLGEFQKIMSSPPVVAEGLGILQGKLVVGGVLGGVVKQKGWLRI
jgi:hypothetical protein